MTTASTLAPSTFEDAAAALAAATQDGHTVRIVGAGTKLGWGSSDVAADIELHTSGLDEVVAHDAGDLTATLQAGVPLELAQRTFAAAGQMLALDPPLGAPGDIETAPAHPSHPGPTIGGVVATADSGPLRHRYGAPRDLVVGATVALSDGTIAQAGGKVIKNVAGYDLAKLFSGAFGTLGLILSVNVRLHPLHETSVTALGAASDPDALSRRRRPRRRPARVRSPRRGLEGRSGRTPAPMRGPRGSTPGAAGGAADARRRTDRRRRD